MVLLLTSKKGQNSWDSLAKYLAKKCNLFFLNFGRSDVHIHKDFILRSIVQMVLLDNLEGMKQLLNSFFCRIYSKTDGCLLNGRNTASDNEWQFLRQKVVSGVVE